MHEYLSDHPFVPKKDPFSIKKDNTNNIVFNNNPCPKNSTALEFHIYA